MEYCSHTAEYVARYRVGSWSLRVSDDLIDSVEVIKGEEHDSSHNEVNNWSCESDFCLVDDPNIAGDASAWVRIMVLLAVRLAYLRMGNAFMKLRVNMMIININGKERHKVLNKL